MEENARRGPLPLSPVRLLFPFLFWVVLIFALSAYPKAIIPQGKYISWDKLAHLAEFSVLGYLTARTCYFSGVAWLNAHFALATLTFGLLYAASDEWHQLHVPGRLASPYDVMADVLGVLLGLFIFVRSIRRLRLVSHSR